MNHLKWAAGAAPPLAAIILMVGTSTAQTNDASGRKPYADNCASCHGDDMRGGSGPVPGPALLGPAFAARWQKLPAHAFLDFISKTMPFQQPGSLDAATNGAIASFILSSNGLPADVARAASPTTAAAAPKEIAVSAEDRFRDATYREQRVRLDEVAAKVGKVGDADLQNPSGNDWLTWRRTLSAQGFSPLSQIDRANVSSLTLAWSASLGTGSNGIAPLVHDGVLYVNSNGTVRAIDAASGEVLWEYSRPAKTTRIPLSQTRGMALYDDAIFVSTIDNHVLALDVRTGQLRWDHEIGKPADRLELTAAPLAIKGKIIQGVSGCQSREFPGGCFIVALDAASGKEVWRVNTIARPGEAGGDSWNGAPLERRSGGSIWTAGSYDAGLNLVYFGTGQTYVVSTLLQPPAAPSKANDALYTNTTLAIDPDTGRLVWAYQHAPRDVWDLDWAFERTLAYVPVAGRSRKVVMTVGKPGIIDVLDARTGRYLWSKDLGLQNVIVGIDRSTGRKAYDPRLTPGVEKPKLICPSVMGARNWPATAYDPRSNVMFLPMAETCMDFGLNGSDVKGYSETRAGELSVEMRPRPDSDGRYGRVVAFDVAGQRIVWTNRRRANQSSAILATAGGLVFEGGRDRYFRALDSATGATLWQTRLDNPPNAFPISYSVGGVQYVAIVTGGGTPVDSLGSLYTPEIPAASSSKTLMVFALPR
ncbi:MAG: PQQ-binding-like beta-propeller repeat protein [Sphingomonadaceae bacterium]